MCSSIGSRSSSLAGRAICPLRSASDLNEGDVACQKSPKRVIFPSLPTSPLPLPLPSPLPLLLFPPPSPSPSPPSPPPLPSSLIPTERERESVFTCLRMTRACSFSPLRQQCVCPRLCILALLWRSPSSLSSAPPSRLCAEWQRGWAPSRPPWRPAYVRFLMVTEDVF